MIGENIKKQRLLLGLSQTELALKCGYKYPSAISKIEKGERDISSSTLVKIAAALDTSPEALILGYEVPEKQEDAVLYDMPFNNLVSDLERLGALYQKGLLTEAEYIQAKNKLLK